GESTGPGDLEGNFSIILDGTSATPEALQDGENTHTVIVTARDSAGNISNQSLKVISQDTNDPTEPIITSIAGDNIINAVEKSAIIVEGSAEPYSTVSVGITDGTSSISGNTTCDATGVFEISLNGNNALPETLIDGTDHITISIIAIDTVGNSSEEIKSIASQDTVKPNQPAVSTPTNGSIIDDSTVTDVQISGTTESGNMVTVILYDGDQIIQSSEISEDGSYTLSIDTTILKDGDNKISVTVKAQDLGGNTSDEVSLTLSKHTTEGAAAEAALVASQSSSSNSISSSNSGGGNGGAGGGGGGGGGSGNEGNENSSGILSVYDPNYSNPELEKVIAARKTEKTITGPVTAELVGMVLQNNGDELINAVITKGIGYLLQTDNQSTLALFIPKDTHVVAKKIWDLVIHPPEIVSRNIIRRSGAIILGSSEKLMQESIRTIISAGSDITALYFTEAISLQVPMSVSEQDKVRVYRSEDKEILELMSDEDIHVSQNNVVINSDKLSSFAIQVESATSHPASVIDPDLPFEDAQGHWAKDYIKELYQKQIISGKTLSTFAPDEPITRAELTKIALNAFQVQLPKSIDEIPFADVS
ncbi:MAG: S-layer homology domain-containing protein, partial [Candidatus Gracilibacteria bacterium]|nr:S-layer homology domain-containing protein [Candidatus Gracilibacteria bacterium]